MLISKIYNGENGIISTYKAKNGKMFQILENKVQSIPGIKPRKRVMEMDYDGTVLKCTDILKSGKDVYMKNPGSEETLFIHGRKKTILNHLNFETLCARFFK